MSSININSTSIQEANPYTSQIISDIVKSQAEEQASQADAGTGYWQALMDLIGWIDAINTAAGNGSKMTSKLASLSADFAKAESDQLQTDIAAIKDPAGHKTTIEAANAQFQKDKLAQDQLCNSINGQLSSDENTVSDKAKMTPNLYQNCSSLIQIWTNLATILNH